MISQMTATVLSEVQFLLGGEAFPKCESPSLRLEKFVRIGGDSTKRDEIDAVVKCQRKHGMKPQVCSVPSGGVRFPAKLKSRLIVNQAGGILENAGLCLHPHFGYPYIPGSTVKGVARHAAWCAWHEAEGETKEALARQMATVFGYPTGDTGLDAYLKGLTCNATRGGCVAFFAALPDGKADLVTDIVNCHHMKYYGDDNQSAVATDDEAPNPQFFPAVEAGATFLFTLAPLRGAGEAELKFAKECLIKALTENGVGAKTSAGYGWFEYEDLSSAQPGQDLLNQWKTKYPSATKQRKDFFLNEKLGEIDSRSATFKRTVLEFYLQAEWWQKEKKNTGSKITTLVTKLASKFGLEDRLS